MRMPNPFDSRQVGPLPLAGALAIAAGVTFFATVTYLFTALRWVGLDLAMFDDPARLLLWADDHSVWYKVMWLLYFISQALLLCVPWLLGEDQGTRVAAVLGTTSVAMAMIGIAVQYAVSPVTGAAYQAVLTAGTPSSSEVVLALHNTVSDAGKDIRLFSETMLGVWLVLVGTQLRRRTGDQAWWLLVALGCWTTVVAAWKLFDPAMPHEDWLAFLLGAGYVGLGVGLIRLSRGASQPAVLARPPS